MDVTDARRATAIAIARQRAGRDKRRLRRALLNAYLHRLPHFRGKWRLLRLIEPLVDGTPVRSRYGVDMLIEVGDRTNQYCVLGRYDDVVPLEAMRLSEGEAWFGVGANCGLFSLMAAGQVGPTGLVLSFEPCLATYAKLVANIALNGFDNIVPFNLALAEKTGLLALDTSTTGHSGLFAIDRGDADQTTRIAAVNTVDFAALVMLLGDRRTTVKIDVEGFEVEVLRALGPILDRKETERVVIEIDEAHLSRYGSTPQQIFDLLEARGFQSTIERRVGKHYDQVFVRDSAEGAGAAPASPAPGAVDAVSDLELAAYVEERLENSRVIAVEDYLARHPRRAARIAGDLRARHALALATATGGGRQAGTGSVVPFAKRTRAAGFATGMAAAAGLAAMLLVGPQDIIRVAGGSATAATPNYVDEALESHRAAMLRAGMQSQPKASHFDPDEVRRATGISVPRLPRGWEIMDAQLFPSDKGPALYLSIRTHNDAILSVFAVHGPTRAPAEPDAIRYHGYSVAFWKHGDVSYALMGSAPPDQLHRIADLLDKEAASEGLPQP